MWCGRLSQNLLRFTLGNMTQMALFPHVLSYLSAHFPADSTGGSFQTGKRGSNQTGKKSRTLTPQMRAVEVIPQVKMKMYGKCRPLTQGLERT